MKIYTRTGDDGETSLFGGGRVRKNHRRVAAYGDLDELNAVLGWAASELAPADPLAARLRSAQRTLFGIGGEVATENDAARSKLRGLLTSSEITELEESIDAMEEELPELRSFVLPGGSRACSALHVARTVCRRAERAIVALAETDAVRGEIVRYLNRLSDWLFVAARFENRSAGGEEILW